MNDRIECAWRPGLVLASGEAGVGRAALAAAKACDIRTGGFALRGAVSEADRAAYELTEHWSVSRHRPVAQNMRLSNATLLCVAGPHDLRWGYWDVGDLRRYARELQRPLAAVDLGTAIDENVQLFQGWLEDFVFLSGRPIEVLHVVGVSERQVRGIEEKARVFFERCWTEENHGEEAVEEDGAVNDPGGTAALGGEVGPDGSEASPAQDQGERLASL